MADEQHNTPNPSRRSLLGSALAGSVAVPSASAALVAAEVDAELCAWSHQLVAENAETLAIEGPYYNVVGPFPADVTARSEELTESYHELRRMISLRPARTLAGLRAKAEAAMVQYDPCGTHPPDPESDDFLGWSICRDILNGVTETTEGGFLSARKL